MTPEQMDQLDRALAEKLMGWTDYPPWEDDVIRKARILWYDHKLKSPDIYMPKALVAPTFGWSLPVWHPTRNISQALGDGGEGTVVGELRKLGMVISLDEAIDEELPYKWSCAIELVDNPYPSERIYATADTPSLAICLAAANALGIEVK